ncbi:peptidase S16 [Methanoculleus sp. Wushi-C6]|uniref:Peptidase S16 n=1 Tax=Methanoculleus caldifontis TaxID=2651577 RepID=A0ABU3WXJ5_9EURY|nr:S16 family serine protease [Methanoculleus sp. Wushi-C6]MDV2480529.1 peptidase S16 [Methanoculleus sp. Wushi-C6]
MHSRFALLLLILVCCTFPASLALQDPVGPLPGDAVSPAPAYPDSATLSAPVVVQRIELVRQGLFLYEQVTEEGAMVTVTVEVVPGKGRLLVHTTPLMGVIFQDAARTALAAAERRTGADLSGSDVIVSLQAGGDVNGIDGPSAGALMAVLMVSALEGFPLNESVTVTGTIDSAGRIGRVDGIGMKAEAAAASGRTLLLIPQENSVAPGYRGLGQGPVTDMKAAVEGETDIRVEYVATLDDALRYLRAEPLPGPAAAAYPGGGIAIAGMIS